MKKEEELFQRLISRKSGNSHHGKISIQLDFTEYIRASSQDRKRKIFTNFYFEHKLFDNIVLEILTIVIILVSCYLTYMLRFQTNQIFVRGVGLLNAANLFLEVFFLLM